MARRGEVGLSPPGEEGDSEGKDFFPCMCNRHAIDSSLYRTVVGVYTDTATLGWRFHQNPILMLWQPSYSVHLRVFQTQCWGAKISF